MSSKRILVVDDEPSVGMLISHVLRDGGYDVRVARGGNEALEILLQPGDFDLAFVDLMMPDLSGEEVIHLCKRLHPKLSVVLMTAELEDRVPIRSQVDHYLTKPFRLAQLEEITRRALGHGRPRRLVAPLVPATI